MPSHRSRSRSRRSRSCPRGTIRRSPYVRRSRSGRRSRVASTCIVDRGLPGKGPKTLPVPERGVLSRFGYYNVKTLPKMVRQRILKRIIKAYGPHKTISHLNLIANFTQRSDPAAHAIFRQDLHYVSAWLRAQKARSPSRLSSR